MSLKEKAVNGVKWKFTEQLVNYFSAFAIGIVLARLLSPSDYGLVGMVTVLVAFSEALVDGGYSDALIRKKQASEDDYNTVFFLNLGMALLLYLILFFSAGFIAEFYHRSELVKISRVVGINIVFYAFGLVETAQLKKKIHFKALTKISITASLSSGIIAIVLAFLGFGYWTIVIRTLVANCIRVVMLMSINRWIPTLRFKLASFKELFAFGYKLTISGLIDSAYRQIMPLIIGRAYSADQLGYYSRSTGYTDLFSKYVSVTVQSVTYPVLCNSYTDIYRLKSAYRAIIRTTFYISCILTIILVGCAREFILVLIGEKWFQSIQYLKIIGFSAMLYPLHAANLNLLKTLNRSDLYLKLEIIKKALLVPILVICLKYGILALLYGLVTHSFISYYVNSYYSSTMIGYSYWQQIKDLRSTILTAIAVLAVSFIIEMLLPISLILVLVAKVVSALLIVISLGEVFKIFEYLELKSILVKQVSRLLSRLFRNSVDNES